MITFHNCMVQLSTNRIRVFTGHGGILLNIRLRMSATKATEYTSERGSLDLVAKLDPAIHLEGRREEEPHGHPAQSPV